MVWVLLLETRMCFWRMRSTLSTESTLATSKLLLLLAVAPVDRQRTTGPLSLLVLLLLLLLTGGAAAAAAARWIQKGRVHDHFVGWCQGDKGVQGGTTAPVQRRFGLIHVHFPFLIL